MRLNRIAIREFKQFADPLVIDGLEPGLNLFTGPNEAGKSTIAEAVRTVFLERYKASHLKDLLPWGKSGGQPAVEVSFTLDGVECTLAKQFVSRQRCDLRIGAKAFSEDEAEEQLAALLGFSRATRGAVKAEHAGVPGLLWVQQGETQEIRDSSGHAAQYLRDALAQLSGSRESAGEDALIASVQRELRKLLTERTQKSTGALADAEHALAASQHECAELARQRQQFDENIARLASQQDAFDDAQKKRPWDAHEQKAVDAQKRADAAAELERSLQGLAQAVQVSEAELAVSMQHEQRAVELEQTVARERLQLDTSNADAAAAQDAHTQAVARVAQHEQTHADTNRALELANAAVTEKDLTHQIALYRDEIERLDAAIAAAEAAQAAVLEATQAAAALEIDADTLDRLRKLDARLVPLRARRDAAMTRIEYRLTGAMTVNGETVGGDGVLRIVDATTIGLPGLGELRVMPGESDLSAVLDELGALESQHAQCLRTLGVASLADATQRHEQWKAAVAHQQSQTRILAAHAPKGIESMRAAHAATLARLQTADSRVAALPDVSDAPEPDVARRSADAAREALDTARHALAQTAEKRSTVLATAASLAAQLQRNEQSLQDVAFRQQRAQWQAKLVEQRAHVAALNAQLASRTLELDAARIDDPVAEAKRYRDSAQLAHSEQHQRQLRIAELRSQLETVGASGLGERLAQAQAAAEQAQRRHDELSLRAGALRLLDEVLVAERDAAVAQLQAPLTERLGHYLKRIFPQSAMTVGDDLSPATLHRAGRIDTLEALSYGTREQLGILTRLAYADLLKEAGRPTLLMLDDAAVHTDAARRDAIKRALLDAAGRHQILLFTCHPELWDDLGVRQRAIDDLRIGA
ncbi:AAA family ATPase [Paraburkholderia sp.]|uniref:AAA family ATPase n=1 Tax=Paraburkholderia sp. TaxID=1926495 RepID=UPI0023A357A5|nr:AAA family ATPase [Paraburkholderia sp.]MDE1182514.1 AAA family ATPase [Paraburkholderia sp.]